MVDEQGGYFETTLIFGKEGISMKNNFNGGTEVSNQIEDEIATYG